MLMTSLDKSDEGLKGLDPASNKQQYGSAAHNYYYSKWLNAKFEPSPPVRRVQIGVVRKCINFRLCGLFAACLVFYLYGVWKTSNEKQPFVRSKLLMANVFIRHGDRAPTDEFPLVDRHADNPTLFWPNGHSNLTEMGEIRMYKLGLETRRHYKHYLDYDSRHILALSSPLHRCTDSMQFVLRGLYNTEWTRHEGRALVSRMNSCSNKQHLNQSCSSLVSSGSGSPLEWLKVKIDSEFLPTLYDNFLDNCAYNMKNPSTIEKDLMESINIRSLPGIEKLRDTLVSRYNNAFNSSLLGLVSTIIVELNIVRTESTYNYTDHFNDWIDEVIIDKPDYKITLFDLFEQVGVYSIRDRYSSSSDRIQTGHIITSILESQLIALGYNASERRMKNYYDKKVILYASHDTVLHRILQTLHVIHIDSSFEDRFSSWYESGQDANTGLLSGLKVPSFGMSFRLELRELESEDPNCNLVKNKFQYVQLSIYNDDDVKFHNIEYKILDFGTACNRMFKIKYPQASSEQLSSFYKTSFQFDEKQNCPFELFKNVTSDLMLSDAKLHQLCDSDK